MDLLKNGRLALIQVELLAGEIKLGNQIQQSRNIQRLRVWQRTYLANDLIADDFLYCQSKQEADERRDDLHGYGIYLTDVGEDAGVREERAKVATRPHLPLVVSAIEKKYPFSNGKKDYVAVKSISLTIR